jgi:hypothetical protein
MDSNKINKIISYQINSTVNEPKTKENNKSIRENCNDEVCKETNASVISKEAVIGYEFLSRIKASVGEVNKAQSIEQYAFEYKKIKDEIVSGKYGNDTKKYMKLLDKAFKDTLENAVNTIEKTLNKTLEKTNDKHNKVKFSGADLIKYQKQYDTATGIAWILRAENKRISQEIDECRRKKDHRKVASLTQLKNTYSKIISNVSDIATKIRTDIDDNFSKDKIKE